MQKRFWSAAVLILALLVSACGGKTTEQPSSSSSNQSSSSQSATTPAPAPAKKEPTGSFTVVQGAEPDILEPLYSDGSAEYTIVVNIMEGLFTTGKNLEITPVLAESYKVIDPLTWEFKLRKGVKFQNGEDFKADSVKLSYDNSINKDLKVRNAWGGDINLKEVQIVDDYTVRFITSEPTPQMLARMANDHYMYPPKYYKEVGGKEGFSKKPVGTGPYKFVSWNKGDKIVLEANTDYWGGVPSIKTVTWRFVPEEGARIAELESGNVDMVIGIGPDMVPNLQGKSNVKVVAIEGGRRIYLGLLTQGDVPTANVKVRQALNYGVNVEAIAQTLFAGAVKRMPTPTNPPNRNPDVKKYTYDPEMAKRLLTEAGYPNGFSAELQAYLGGALKDREFLQAVVADLKKINVNLDLKIMERAAFNTMVKGRKNGAVYLRTTAGGFDMGIDLLLFRPSHSGNGTKWEPKSFTDLYTKVLSTTDLKLRNEYSYQAQKLIMEEAPWIFLWRQPEIYGISSKLKGFDPQGDERVRVFQLSK